MDFKHIAELYSVIHLVNFSRDDLAIRCYSQRTSTLEQISDKIFVQGFIQISLPPPPPPPPPEIMKLSVVIIVLSQVLNNNPVPDCVRSNLRGNIFKIFLP